MGLQETAQSICCNMLICCPWLQSLLLENHRGVCQALAQSRAEGSSACAAMGSALGPMGKAHGSRDRGGDRGRMVSWLSLGKKSAWTEGQREAAPAVALEVSLPCLKVILGGVAKDQKKADPPCLYPAPHPLY